MRAIHGSESIGQSLVIQNSIMFVVHSDKISDIGDIPVGKIICWILYIVIY